MKRFSRPVISGRRPEEAGFGERFEKSYEEKHEESFRSIPVKKELRKGAFRKTGTGILAALAAAVLTAGSMASAAFASEADPTYSVSVMDPAKTGSVTIHKLVNNDGTTVSGTGLPLETLPDGMTALAGVTFRCIKIADISQKVSNGISDLYAVNLEAGYGSLLNARSVPYTSALIGGVACTPLSELNSAQKALNAAAEEDVRTYLRQNGTALAATDENGIASVDGLAVGIYLFAETEGPSSIVSPCSPFLISLPMTNAAAVTVGADTYAAGTVWQYDVSVYPKNKTAAIRAEVLSADGTPLAGTHAQMGDTVTVSVSADVPKLTASVYGDAPKNSRFIVTETLSPAFVYQNDLTVSLGKDIGTAAVLTADTDYTAAAEGDTVTVTLTAAGLAKLDAVTEKNTLFLTSTSKCGSAAEVGTENNTNEVSLTYATDRTADTVITGSTARLYTYEIDMTKQFDTDADPSAASFEISRAGVRLSFVPESEGIYHAAVGNEAEGTAVTALSPDAQTGVLSLKGMDADTYTITELSTAAGFRLLSGSFTVTLGSADPAAAGLASASISQDGTETPLTEGLSEGHVRFTITNTSGIALPMTGGTGATLLLILGGICLMIPMAVLAASRFRKRKTARR